MFDLTISEHGDLVLAGNRDLAGVSGTDLVNQRIRLRLIVHRGEWFYDRDGTFGSNLHDILGKSPASAIQTDAYVREALRSMEDISIEDISTDYDEDAKSLFVSVSYIVADEIDQAALGLPGEDTQQTTVIVPVGEG
jgi:phage baseplate assembly protein W